MASQANVNLLEEMIDITDNIQKGQQPFCALSVDNSFAGKTSQLWIFMYWLFEVLGLKFI